MIVLLTGSVLAFVLTAAQLVRDRNRYLTILKASCITLVVEWLLLAIPVRVFRFGYAGTDHLLWINVVAVTTTTLVLAWLITVAVMARDPD